jgi:hypothetical protein
MYRFLTQFYVDFYRTANGWMADAIVFESRPTIEERWLFPVTRRLRTRGVPTFGGLEGHQKQLQKEVSLSLRPPRLGDNLIE